MKPPKNPFAPNCAVIRGVLLALHLGLCRLDKRVNLSLAHRVQRTEMKQTCTHTSVTSSALSFTPVSINVSVL